MARCTPDRVTTHPTRLPTASSAGIGAWQTLLRTPVVSGERQPNDIAGRRLTSVMRPRNLEQEEKKQREERIKHLLIISRSRPGIRLVRLEYRGPAGPTASDIEISRGRSGFGPRFEQRTGRTGSARPWPVRPGPVRERWPQPRRPLDLQH